MDELEAFSGASDTKPTQLQFTRDRTDKIIQNGKSDAVERQVNARTCRAIRSPKCRITFPVLNYPIPGFHSV